MGRKKAGEAIELNRIADEMKKNLVKNPLIAVWTGINIKTVSTWRSNTSQPSDENLEQLGELFEIHTGLLRNSPNRIRTGLATALQKELTRIIDEEKVPFEITINDSKTGNSVKVINPDLQKRLKLYAKKHAEKNLNTISPLFLDKYYKDIESKERNSKAIFICKAMPQEGKPYFEYLVVNESLGENHLVARFARKEDAEAYVEWLDR